MNMTKTQSVAQRDRVWILGGADPEMEAIERMLVQCGERVSFATRDGERVRGGGAYGAGISADADLTGGTVYVVETDGPESIAVVRIDHHRPGDPGYGHGPEEFFDASSIGQVLSELVRLGLSPDRPADLLLIAAADHCLTHAAQGRCPGVTADELLRWRCASRAAYQGRSVESIVADIAAARIAVRAAPRVVLRNLRDAICAQDMRGAHVPELPDAAALEGVCVIADGLPGRDNRVKIVCMGGSVAEIISFRDVWAPENGLTDIYAMPDRGLAGGYLAPMSRVEK